MGFDRHGNGQAKCPIASVTDPSSRTSSIRFDLAMERQANPYSELFHHCVQVLNTYPANISEEIFLDEYFRTHQVFYPLEFSFVISMVLLSSRSRMSRSSRRFSSIVFAMRLCSERSSTLSIKPMDFTPFASKKISTKVKRTRGERDDGEVRVRF